VACRAAARLSSETLTATRPPAAPRAPAADRGGRFHFREQQTLKRVRADRSAQFKLGGYSSSALVAKELLRPLGDRRQTHDTLLRLDDAAFPFG
jgi:hypothetical protein